MVLNHPFFYPNFKQTVRFASILILCALDQFFLDKKVAQTENLFYNEN
jgi:hypothetical protein